jgi:hypothetical protein
MEKYLSTIVGVLTRSHITAIAPKFTQAPKGFFEVAKTDDADGFEWDMSDGEGEEEGVTTANETIGISGRGLPMPNDNEVDLDRL